MKCWVAFSWATLIMPLLDGTTAKSDYLQHSHEYETVCQVVVVEV